MSRRATEIFLARRLSRRKGERRGGMLVIATISVAVSMAVMLVSMSVIGGFKGALEEILTGFAAHVRVEVLQAASVADATPLELSPEFEQKVAQIDHFGSIARVAEKSGIIKSATAMQGTLIKGVDVGYDSLFYRSCLVEGRLPRIGGESRTKDILVSEALANMLEVGLDDKVEMVFTSPEAPIRRDAYKIVGIYNSGMTTMDSSLALTDIRNIQRLNGWSENQVTCYEIMADDVAFLDEFAGGVRVEALYGGGETLWRTTDLRSSYPQYFDWLATHDINGVVIIVIMIVVALLNMITALLIIIFERIQMIGTLKALGMRNGAIQRVFLWRSLSVIVRGLAWGNAIGLGLMAVQHLTGVFKLDAEAYILSSVPVSFELWWWLGLNLLVPLVLVVLLSVPVAVISRIKPDQTLKYQ
ncbi:MAG: ABC transporter permease [Tidjanibacter sp.]|nr:ABC transporter permease [Tidjanibacter sp.]MBQ5931413.1 ABC transporter permease [Tidjanibacter sp.]